jgi:hypothetical protein
METEMKLSIAISALLVTAFVTASTEKAKAEEVYCYPTGCVAQPYLHPVGRAVAREAVRSGTPVNRGGPVDRVDRR